MTPKILILSPNFNKQGGISKYCTQISLFMKNPNIVVYRGSEEHHFLLKFTPIRLMWHYLKFLIILLFYNIQIVHQNTSLGQKGILRDSIYIILSKLLQKKVLLFIHGWDEQYAQRIDKSKFNTFRIIYRLSDQIIVLSQSFKDQLIRWNFNENIIVERNFVNQDDLAHFQIEDKIRSLKEKKEISLLFLSRLEKEKGLYESIEIFQSLKDKSYPVKLNIAGDGPEYEKIQMIQNSKPDIQFHHYVSGKDKIELFSHSDIFLLPSYSEGMPISMLEAMSFGMLIICRTTGGIKDFFENDKMGYSQNENSIMNYVEQIEYYINRRDKMAEIATYNYRYSQQHFYLIDAIQRLENIYKGMINENSH